MVANNIANIAAYKFVPIGDRDELRASLRSRCRDLDLKGTILLAPEGINLFLAGSKDDLIAFLDSLTADPRFSDLAPKWSWSDFVPFKRLRVKLKDEIVTLRVGGIDPATDPAPLLPAAELKRWYDEGRDFVIVDTRNEWEVSAGCFENAIDPHLKKFGEFPRLAETLAHLKDKVVVTYCTGGIRCEKAAPLLQSQGFRQVYQLQGGILKYFEECGGAHWRGNCVVFDDRGALDPQLRPAGNPG
jgi:UPF0176 protein